MNIQNKFVIQLIILSLLWSLVMLTPIFYIDEVVTRSDKVMDISMHLSRIENISLIPIDYEGVDTRGYYGPLFHILIGYPSYIMGIRGRFLLSIGVSFMCFFALPYSVYYLAKTYFKSVEAGICAGLCYLVGTHNNVMYIFTSTYSQGLNQLIILFMLSFMIKEIRDNKNIRWSFVFCFLGVLSHSTGAVYSISLFICYLFLRKKYLIIGLLGSCVAWSVVFFPVIWSRFKGYSTRLIDSGVSIVLIKNMTFEKLSWLNPLIMFPAIMQIKEDFKKQSTEFILLLFAFVIPILSSPICPFMRPLLNVSALGCVLGSKIILKHFNEDFRSSAIIIIICAFFVSYLLAGNLAMVHLNVWGTIN